MPVDHAHAVAPMRMVAQEVLACIAGNVPEKPAAPGELKIGNLLGKTAPFGHGTAPQSKIELRITPACIDPGERSTGRNPAGLAFVQDGDARAPLDQLVGDRRPNDPRTDD